MKFILIAFLTLMPQSNILNCRDQCKLCVQRTRRGERLPPGREVASGFAALLEIQGGY